jgi:fatty acid desaturase
MNSITKNLTPAKFAFLEMMLLLPTVNFCLLLWYGGMPMVSLTVYMLVCLLLMPIAYVLYLFIHHCKTALRQAFQRSSEPGRLVRQHSNRTE